MQTHGRLHALPTSDITPSLSCVSSWHPSPSTSASCRSQASCSARHVWQPTVCHERKEALPRSVTLGPFSDQCSLDILFLILLFSYFPPFSSSSFRFSPSPPTSSSPPLSFSPFPTFLVRPCDLWLLLLINDLTSQVTFQANNSQFNSLKLNAKWKRWIIAVNIASPYFPHHD